MNRRWVDLITKAIVAECAPDRVILFGSAAWKFETGQIPGDLDFLVIGPSALSRAERSGSLKDLLPHVPMRVDLIHLTSPEAEAEKRDGVSLVSKALTYGECTYSRA